MVATALTLAHQSRLLLTLGIESTVNRGVLSAEFSVRPFIGARMYKLALVYRFLRRPVAVVVAPDLTRRQGRLPHNFVPLTSGKYAGLPNLCLFQLNSLL